MSRKQQRPKPPIVDDDPGVVPFQLWRDGEFRLNLMEHRAFTALRIGAAMTRIVVEVAPGLTPDLWTPGAGPSGAILGPDGKPLVLPSGSSAASSSSSPS